ncbi:MULTISPECIES: DUF6941 family protein [Bacteria]|uniref:DUF6941 family protein n=1 Tax=Bacteria TaxID=2 RepID=UPI0036F686D8
MPIQGDVIFCDDIRHEITGKAILVGAYGATLRTSGDLPFTIDRLVLACRLYIPAANIPKQAKFLVYYPQSKEAPDFESELNMPEQLSVEKLALIPRAEDRFEPRFQMSFQIELEKIDIEIEGFIRVRAILDDEYVRVGDLRVSKIEENDRSIEEEPST